MPRIYDSSHLTQRKGERATAGSFLTVTASNVMQGSKPLLGIKDSSIMYAVKSGHMTQYTRFPTCVGISPGCPCPELNASLSSSPVIPAIPGQVTGIIFTIGSVIISWTPMDGSFIYIITPYLNGVALPSVATSNTTYTFTNLEEMQPYTFTICASKDGICGPLSTTPSIIAPPQILGDILMGTAPPVDVSTSLAHIVNTGLNYVMQYAVNTKKGPTIASRLMYIWVVSVVQAWNYITADIRVTGVHDGWNWDTKSTTLVDCDKTIWICSIIDYITPVILPGAYRTIYNCSPTEVERVKTLGNWNGFVALWNAWLIERTADGAAAAISTMPIGIDNWLSNPDGSINPLYTINVNGTNDINAFPEPQKWTRLTVNGVQQKYLTYTWDNVRSTCLSNLDELDIEMDVSPAADRDKEIDDMKTIVATMGDKEKVEAEFWAGSDAGIISPPLMAIWLWKEYVRSIGVTCPTLMYSLLDLAIHMFEGARVTWRLKAKYMEDRPIQEVRRRYAGQQIASWNGVIDGASWVPYQSANFVTPPFADFPSGHSNFMKGFSLTMTKWFGPMITKNDVSYENVGLMSPLTIAPSAAYGDFTISSGSSTIQSTVPAANVLLEFDTWDKMAESAGMSRIYGGIHTETANTASQTVAGQVDSYINSTWNIDFTEL